MADMSGIYSFNNSDGLPPQVVAKMNHDLWAIIQKIAGGDIVMAAGSTLPDPRIDESLFYNKDTGELYIWNYFEPVDPDTQEPLDPYWGWAKVDMGLIEIVDTPPTSRVRESNALIKYLLTDQMAMPYFWIDNGDNPRAGWYSLKTLIENWSQ